MSGELNIQDSQLYDEFMSYPAPIAFIDFETITSENPGVIPGTRTTDSIPVQWSCHTLYEHGLEWRGNLEHDEFLWTGDRGWSPVYAFVESLYHATYNAATIFIYSQYEVRVLTLCKQLAENDMARWEINDILNGLYTIDEYGEMIPLAADYSRLLSWIKYRDFDYCVYDENGDEIPISEISDTLERWKSSDPLPYDYHVVTADGNKVPVMEIAPVIEEWCDSMIERIYDMCWGPLKEDYKSSHAGGVEFWLQSREFENSNSIKHVLPAAMAEYSGSEELLLSEGEPLDGYKGLRAMGHIAKGDECQSHYQNALDREPRSGVDLHEPGAAPFDPNIEAQCLQYCRLDTLSMVIVYLAVVEATERWIDNASDNFAEFAYFSDDGLMHFIEFDADGRCFYKGCDENWDNPYPYDYELELYSEMELNNMPIREQYSAICPQCRRLRNMS